MISGFSNARANLDSPAINILKDKINEGNLPNLDKLSLNKVSVKAVSFADKFDKISSQNTTFSPDKDNVAVIKKSGFVPTSIDLGFSDNTTVKVTNTNTTLESSVKKSIDELKALEKDVSVGNSSSEINIEFIYSISDTLAILESTNNSQFKDLSKISSILDKVTLQNKLSNEELKTLKEFSLFVSNNAETIGVDKGTFNKLSQIIDGVQVARAVAEEKKDKLLQTSEEVKEKIQRLATIASDPKLKLDTNFVLMVQNLSKKYQGVVNSKDPVQIMIFSGHLEKILQTMEDIKSGKEKNPNVFGKLQNDYQQFTDKFFQRLSQDGKPPLDLLASYLGKERAEHFAELLDIKLTELKATPSTPDKPNPIETYIQEAKSNLTFTFQEKKCMCSVKLESVSNAMKNEEFSKTFGELKSSIVNLNFNMKELSGAYKNLNKQESSFAKMVRDEAFRKELQRISKFDPAEIILSKEIQDTIDRAEKLEGKIDLNVNTKESNVSSLLEKFRKIIVNLDFDLRRLKSMDDERKMIDEKYLKSVKANTDEQNRLDKQRLIQLKTNTSKLVAK